ncbi:hypothetical protein SprV_0301015300 [Sparganum proliferum]
MKGKKVSPQDTCRSLLTGILEEPTGVCSGPLLGDRLTELLHQRQAKESAFADSTAVIQQTIRVEESGAVGWGTQCVEGEEAEEGPRRVTFRELEALVDTAAARLQTQLADLPFSRDLAKLTDCAELSSERRSQIERLQERSLVIICMPACLGRVVIQLACMKLRLAYAPVDRHFPKNQITRILQEFAPVACIVEEDSDDGSLFLSNQSTGTAKLISSSELFSGEYVKRLRQGSQCLEVQSCRALFSTVADPVILVLFTSGSTSPTPKGVALRNRQLMNRLDWQWSPASPLAGLTGPSLAKTSWLFVDGFTEVFGALLAGRPILLPLSPRGHLSTVQMFTDAALLASVVRKFDIVQLIVVPEQLQSWLVQIEATATAAAAGVADCHLIGHFSSLEVLVVSGQLLPVRLAADVFRVFPGGRLRLINLYGSTEVAGDVTAAVFESLEEVLASREKATLAEVDDAFFLPVGLPIKNCEVYVLTRRSEEDECGELQVLSRGETGEVYVSGAAVPTDGRIYAEPVKSYPPLTGQAVNVPTLPNAFSSRSGFRMLFRTGDIGFVSPSNGKLYVCGRCDDTVKVNGVKCNLTAIDTFLAGVIDDVMSNPISQYRRFAPLRATVTQLIDCDRRKAQLVCFYTRQDGISEEAVGESFTSLDLAKLIGGNLPSFVNVKVVQVDVFPTKSISGKIDKIKLKENYLSGMYNSPASAEEHPQKPSETGPIARHLNDRERARAVFAKILGLETANQSAPRPLDDEDFSQVGGDSMTAMLIVSELRRIGLPASIMHFADTGRIGTILDLLTQAIQGRGLSDNFNSKDVFTFKWCPASAANSSAEENFNKACKELVVQMLASSFYRLEPICKCLHFSEEDLRSHVEAQLQPDRPNPAIVLLAGFSPNQTNDAEGDNAHRLLPHVKMVMLLLQPLASTSSCETKPSAGVGETGFRPEVMGEFFEYLASPLATTARPRTLTIDMLGIRTDEAMVAGESIRLATLLEKEVMATAKQLGYECLESVNTSQFTQAICEELEYELVNEADFIAYAKRHGIECDPNFTEIKCSYMVKHLGSTEKVDARKGC